MLTQRTNFVQFMYFFKFFFFFPPSNSKFVYFHKNCDRQVCPDRAEEKFMLTEKKNVNLLIFRFKLFFTRTKNEKLKTKKIRLK